MIVRFCGIHLEDQPRDWRHRVLAEIILERIFKIKFRYHGLARCRMTKAHKAAALLEVMAFVRSIDTILGTKKQSYEVGAIRNQKRSTMHLFMAKKNVEHDRLVIDLMLIGRTLGKFDYAPGNSNSRSARYILSMMHQPEGRLFSPNVQRLLLKSETDAALMSGIMLKLEALLLEPIADRAVFWIVVREIHCEDGFLAVVLRCRARRPSDGKGGNRHGKGAEKQLLCSIHFDKFRPR